MKACDHSMDKTAVSGSFYHNLQNPSLSTGAKRVPREVRSHLFCKRNSASIRAFSERKSDVESLFSRAYLTDTVVGHKLATASAAAPLSELLRKSIRSTVAMRIFL